MGHRRQLRQPQRHTHLGSYNRCHLYVLTHWLTHPDSWGIIIMSDSLRPPGLGLDPPLWFYLPRIFWRTLLRLLNVIPTCAEGCTETWGEVLSTKGIIWYCISNHGYCKHKFGEMLAHTSITKGGSMRRLNEWDGDLMMWKAGLEEMLRTH